MVTNLKNKADQDFQKEKQKLLQQNQNLQANVNATEKDKKALLAKQKSLELEHDAARQTYESELELLRQQN